MTSEAECFVYIALPGETTFVTAGKYVLSNDRRGLPVGRFVYGQSYLRRDDAVPVDPVDLKLEPGTRETRLLNGAFGAIRDASPDYWGRRVIEKYARMSQLGELDYLLQSPDDRAGALSFGRNSQPPAPQRNFNRAMDLPKLQLLADAIVSDVSDVPDVADEDLSNDPDVAQAEALLLVGTSMGGARPKVVVEDEHGLWIAKLNRPDDRWNHARVERAMLVLAQLCGVHAAESRVVKIGDRDALLVKRFDREKTTGGYQRARMLSALTLLRADETDRDKWSYVLLVEALRQISSQAKSDATELFRRMVFNALISNTDDHPRNHAVIAKRLAWRLSPAYDLTPSSPIAIDRRDLAMECGDYGRHANVANLLSQGARFLLGAQEASAIIDDMEQTIKARWHQVARAEGVTERDCQRISGAFAYPGFRRAIGR